MTTDIYFENGDIAIDATGGDFLIKDSEAQHIEDLLSAWAGWYKQAPTVGAGVRRYLGSSKNKQFLKRDIQITLKADGYKVQNVTIDKNWKIYVTSERV
nr:hypothetical protein [uncultured Mediterranean phage uvMED]